MLTTLWKKPEASSPDVSPGPPGVIERGLTVRGHLETSGEVEVNGTFIGRMDVGRMILGVEGYVEGDVVAREVIVYGRLRGRIFAVDVTIGQSANVKGRIFHNTIAVAKGAQIEARTPWRPPNFFETLEELPKEQQ